MSLLTICTLPPPMCTICIHQDWFLQTTLWTPLQMHGDTLCLWRQTRTWTQAQIRRKGDITFKLGLGLSYMSPFLHISIRVCVYVRVRVRENLCLHWFNLSCLHTSVFASGDIPWCHPCWKMWTMQRILKYGPRHGCIQHPVTSWTDMIDCVVPLCILATSNPHGSLQTWEMGQ